MSYRLCWLFARGIRMEHPHPDPADGEHRNCPKYVEFYSKKKFEELVHLVGFIIRIYHDSRSCECQIRQLWSSLLFQSSATICSRYDSTYVGCWHIITTFYCVNTWGMRSPNFSNSAIGFFLRDNDILFLFWQLVYSLTFHISQCQQKLWSK